MDLTQNYFALFGIEPSFQIDKAILADKYRQLQKDLHPDKFANKGATEQRLSVQFTSYVNTAYQTLKSPLLCAEYLLELEKHPVNSETLTVSDGGFLFKQMEWRERLSDLSDDIRSSISVEEKLSKLTDEVSVERADFLKQFERAYSDKQYEIAKESVAKLHFVEKMMLDIERLEDSLFE
ncbi:MAG: Fe-S protein assembly co-chaperone HscB [Cellvibrionaceae bacterium]